jgi:hypothetical protein
MVRAQSDRFFPQSFPPPRARSKRAAISPARPSNWPARLCLLALGAAVPVSSIALAQAENNAATQCEKVSGAFATNFIKQDQTAGTATGDLKGALGVNVLSITGEFGNGKPVTGKPQHFWVTETGDTIFSQVIAETSSNLKDWERLAAKPPVNSTAEFSDPRVTTQPQRFKSREKRLGKALWLVSEP